MKKNRVSLFFFLLVLAVVGMGIFKFLTWTKETEVLKKIISRLEADTRIAEVLVTDVQQDEKTGRPKTTIKFLEYDFKGQPLPPKYFTFSGNIIQFQSLVIRFKDIHIATGQPLKDKSAYLFWKVFMLDGRDTQAYVITPTDQVPRGYRLDGKESAIEEKIWEDFWAYALDPQKADRAGIKNAQIEAPGTMFVPGLLYTLKIEHDGGIRIDALPLPRILKGERIP